MFITFEGIDKSGKTTQAKILIDLLEKRGFKVIFLREPGGTHISEKVRDILLDPNHDEMYPQSEFLLYSASRAQLVNQVIKPALKKNVIVICDRFYDSSTAYQGFGRGIPMKVINLINNFAAGIKPDLTFFIDVNLNESKRRLNKQKVKKDRLEKSGDTFFNKVREGYFKIAESDPERFIIINGKSSKENVANQIKKYVLKKINQTESFNKKQSK